MLQIWGRTNSVNVQKVLWCAAELGIAFSRVDAGGAFGIVGSDEYKERNPNRLVPTIDDNGFVLWESNVIVRYLCAREGRLYPGELHQRFEAERWMDWQQTTLQPAHRAVFLGLVRTPPEKRDMAAIDAGTERHGTRARLARGTARPDTLRRRRRIHHGRHPGRRRHPSLLRAWDRAQRLPACGAVL